MNKLTKLSTVIFVSGIILAGCGSNKELTEKKERIKYYHIQLSKILEI